MPPGHSGGAVSLEGRREVNTCPASKSCAKGSGMGKRTREQDDPTARGGELSSHMGWRWQTRVRIPDLLPVTVGPWS